MKAKPFQISALKSQICQEFDGALLFGTDAARVSDLSKQIKNMILDSNDPFALLTLTPNQLKSSPFLITDEANTPSLMQTRRLIWVKEGTSLSVDALIHFCENKQTNAFLLISAENLPKNSALRLEAESLPNFLTIACYPPEGAELNKMVTDFTKENHFLIEPEAINYLIQNTNSDTLILKNELEKIALYNLDKKPITLEIMQNLIGLGNVDTETFIQYIANKNTTKAQESLTLLINQGEQPVTLLRGIVRYFDTLLLGKNLIKKGKNYVQVADILLKPAQFRLKQPLQEQLRLWSGIELLKAKQAFLEAETQMKSGTLDQVLILKHLLLILSKAPK